MKLMRWVEIRLTGRKSHGNKNKDKSKNDHRKANKCNDSRGINQNKNAEPLEHSDIDSPSFSLEREKANSCDLSSPHSNVFHSSTIVRTSERGSLYVSSRQMASQPQHQSYSSPLLSTPRSRERSRIKTNPWLRSPWLMRQSYGSSSSSDSGYDCNTQNDINDNGRNNRYTTAAPNETLTETITDTLYMRSANSSSEEFANSTSSNSVYSSRSSSIISDCTDIVWTSKTLPSSVSEVANQSPRPSNLNSSLLGNHNNKKLLYNGSDPNNCKINDYNGHNCQSSFTHSIENKQLSSVPRRDTTDPKNLRHKRRIKKINQILTNATKAHRGNERWISLATEQLSSSDEEYNDRDVPSPAPPDSCSDYNLHNFCLTSSIGSNGYIPSPCLLEWTTKLSSGTMDEAYSSDIESDFFKYLNNSIGSTNGLCNTQESMTSSIEIDSHPRASVPVSPQTDSALGLSEVSSTSTTPSIEMKQSDELGRVRSEEIVNNGRCLNDLPLDEKVRQLRIELRDIVDVAMFEARQEELRLREGRIALQKELIQYKRKLLIQTLADLKHRLKTN